MKTPGQLLRDIAPIRRALEPEIAIDYFAATSRREPPAAVKISPCARPTTVRVMLVMLPRNGQCSCSNKKGDAPRQIGK